MVKEIKFPIEFKLCPNCGCADTTCRLAYKQEIADKGKGPKMFASSEKKAVPLIDPRSATLTVPTLLEHYDTCAFCGLRYCTKAEIINAGITMQQSGGNLKPFGFPQGKPGLS
ncbi:hypothetical protein KKF82_08325 [Patescibacteria group bacterium]|nr:hypothetical protein [Patescibacteria group bacterium]